MYYFELMIQDDDASQDFYDKQTALNYFCKAIQLKIIAHPMHKETVYIELPLDESLLSHSVNALNAFVAFRKVFGRLITAEMRMKLFEDLNRKP